jgi:two-component system OmpR family response regulator
MLSTISALLVEDDARLARFTADYLTDHYVHVTHVNDGEAALSLFNSCHFDIILLDVGLPKRDGIVVCQSVRLRSDVPIVVITARGEEADRVLGLEAGADDYLIKPFSPRELLARMRAVVRRHRGELGHTQKTLCVGALVLQEATRSAKLAGEDLVLTTADFDLLSVLARRPGVIFTRDELLALVHGNDEQSFDRAIDVRISRLRQKLSRHPQGVSLIRTVRGVGYMLGDPSC